MHRTRNREVDVDGDKIVDVTTGKKVGKHQLFCAVYPARSDRALIPSIVSKQFSKVDSTTTTKASFMPQCRSVLLASKQSMSLRRMLPVPFSSIFLAQPLPFDDAGINLLPLPTCYLEVPSAKSRKSIHNPTVFLTLCTIHWGCPYIVQDILSLMTCRWIWVGEQGYRGSACRTCINKGTTPSSHRP